MELLTPVFTRVVSRLAVTCFLILVCGLVIFYGDQWGIGHSYPLVSPYHRGLVVVSLLLAALTLYYKLPRYFIMALVLINLVWLLGPFLTFAEKKPLEPVLPRALICSVIAVLTIGYYISSIAVQVYGGLPARLSSLPFLPQYVPPRYPELTRSFREWRKVLRSVKRRIPLTRRLLRNPSANDLHACVMVVGPAQSGKTSALLNAELAFTLPKQQQAARQSRVSTEHNELWLTDDALWCDTPGRYFDPKLATTETADEWQELTKQFVTMRADAEVGAIVFVIDCPRLLSSSSRELTEYAALCRANLRVLQQQMARQLPLYLFISQVDQIVGFREFFHDVGIKERHQLLGEKIEYDQSLPFPRIETISQHLAAMVDRITKQVLVKQNQCEDVSIRKGIELFPTNIEALTRGLLFFIEQMSPSPTERNPDNYALLQGIYFGCSELCRGSTYTHPQSLVRQWLGRPQGTELYTAITDNVNEKDNDQVEIPRSFQHYFIKSLFHHQIIDDYRLRKSQSEQHLPTRFRRIATLVVILLLSAITIYAVTKSYHNNQRYLADSRQKLNQLAQQLSTAPIPLDSALNRLHQLKALHLNDLKGLDNWGLGTRDDWNEEVDSIYNQWLIDHLLPMLETISLNDLSTQLGAGDPHQLLKTLSVYLMLSGELESDNAFLETWFSSHPRLLTAFENKDNLPLLLRRLFRQTTWQTSALSPDRQLIESARHLLSQQPFATYVYQDIMQQLGTVSLPIIDLSQLVTSSQPLLFTFQGKSVPSAGLYNLLGLKYWEQQVLTTHFPIAVARIGKTLYGDKYPNNIKPLLNATDQKLWQQVTTLYLKEYRRYWQDFLNGLHLNLPMTDHGEKDAKYRQRIAYLLRNFTSQDSQLRQLLLNVAKQTQLAPPQKEDERSALSDPLELAQAAKARQQRRENVDHYFIALHRFVEPSSDNGALSLEQLEQALSQLYVTMQATGSTTASQLRALVSEQGEATGFNAVLLHLDQLPSPLPQLFKKLLSVAKQQVVQQTWVNNAKQIDHEIIGFCRQNLMGHYPFSPAGGDADPQAVAEMFSPTGKLTRYFNEHLADKVDTHRSPWRFVAGEQTISPRLLALFEQGHRIQQQLFPQSSSQLGVDLTLSVKDLANGITQLIIDNDEQQFRYVHGPIHQQKIRWPSTHQSPSFQIRAISAEGQSLWNVQEKGYWGLFRWLERSKTQLEPDTQQMDITVGEGAQHATLALSGLDTSAPHLLKLFRHFNCSIR